MRSTKNRKNLKSLIVFILVSILLVTGSFADFKVERTSVLANSGVAGRVRNPRRPADVTTWDCVYFGHYQQTKNDGSSSYSGDFFPEAIKWRVLEKDTENNELFLMADHSLESIQYNEQSYNDKKDITWENSDLRAWLNDDFYNDAFTTAERSDISLSTVTADDNIKGRVVPQGNDTEDYVYCLSQKEVCEAKYGFETGVDDTSETRCSVNDGSLNDNEEDFPYRVHTNKSGTTTFNDGVGTYGKILSKPFGSYKHCGIWWLRTISADSGRLTRIDFDGAAGKTKGPEEKNACVRPVLRVNADSTHLKYAGTVSSNNTSRDYCGDNAEVEFDINRNTLTIKGSGPMYEFEEFSAPWHKYYRQIYTIVVDDQVSSVTQNAFEDCTFATYMYLNEYVTTVSSDAFVADQMDASMLVSVEDNSAAHSRMEQLDWNYTVVRSKTPLCIDIKEIYGVVQTPTTIDFEFDNSCAGQTYEVALDGRVVQTIVDDVHNPEPSFEVGLTDLSSGSHLITIKAVVVGSKNIRRESAGKIIRIKEDGYDGPEWDDDDPELVRWDCVFFGRYPQTRDPEGDYTDPDTGIKYKTEPIKWRVLSNENNQLLLITDKSIDCVPFDTANVSFWQNSSLRAWLNKMDSNVGDPEPGFAYSAFNQDEQDALIETDTTSYRSTTDNQSKEKAADTTVTSDKVFVPGKYDAVNYDYGFVTGDKVSTRTRRSNATDFAARKQASNCAVIEDIRTINHWGKDPSDDYHTMATTWWLRDGRNKSNSCWRINYPGNRDEGKGANGRYNGGANNGCVRPCIKVPADSGSILDAGTIDSYGRETGPIPYHTIRIDGQIDKIVQEGSTYTLPEQMRKSRTISGGANIGFIDDEDDSSVYANGQSFSINRDRNFSRINSITAEPAGTAIKLTKGKPHGIAFACEATIDAYSNPTGNPIHSEAFEYGTLLTTYDDYASVYDNELTVDTQEIPGHKIYRVRFNEEDFTSKPKNYIVGITNLQKANFDRQFVAVPYVLINYTGLGEEAVVYPSYSTPLFVKSAKQVAENLMNSEKWRTGGYNTWQKEWITSYTILD